MPSGAGTVGKRSRVGKAPSEAPAIDKKFMSAPGIRPVCPLLAFMCWGSSGDAALWRRGGTSKIATLSPRTRPDLQHEATQAKREKRQTLDQSIQIVLLVILCWLTLRGTVL